MMTSSIIVTNSLNSPMPLVTAICILTGPNILIVINLNRSGAI